MLLEYIAMFLVYVAVILVIPGNTLAEVVIAMGALLGTMFVARATRDPGP